MVFGQGPISIAASGSRSSSRRKIFLPLDRSQSGGLSGKPGGVGAVRDSKRGKDQSVGGFEQICHCRGRRRGPLPSSNVSLSEPSRLRDHYLEQSRPDVKVLKIASVVGRR